MLHTIAQEFVDLGLTLIVATTTPALQAAYNATKNAKEPPVFFNGVSNPYAAGVAEAPDRHPDWIIGNQLRDPVNETLDLFTTFLPNAASVGVIFNPAEANSAYLVEVAEARTSQLGVVLEKATVANSSEVQTAAEALLTKRIDAYLAISDNTVMSAFPTLIKVANQNDVPVFGTSASMPPLGAVASFGVNPYQEGHDSGVMVVKYLEGELDIAKASIEIQDSVLLTVNPDAANEQGVEVPDSILQQADRIIEE